MKVTVRIMLITAIVGASLLTQAAIAQNATIFGPNVYVFTPDMSDTTIQTTLNSSALSGISQFGTGRIAVLFAPGSYNIEAKVGFYESVAGLGLHPGDVVINGYLTPNFSGRNNANLTTTFWRSMENLTINVATNTSQSAPANTLQWGMSQGGALRRMQINGNLELDDTGCGYSSGGFIADTVVTGTVNPCVEQQWYTRNSSIGGWLPGDWADGEIDNMVFSGVIGACPQSFRDGNVPTVQSCTTLDTTPVVREKPFLYVDGSGNYNVFVPTRRVNSRGTSWSGANPGTGYSLPISSFFIATPSSTLDEVNAVLASGQNLILTPGIYTYSGSINVVNPNTIVLGLGFPDVIPQTGTSAITVADVDGVQIAGLLLDAGPVNSPVLLQVGNPPRSTNPSGKTVGSQGAHESNPTSISDVHVRVGGYVAGTDTTSFEIDSDNVILDNTWIWRADHGADASWTGNLSAHGLVVNGSKVTALGLFVEHHQQNQVVWNGEGGETIFYQSEIPYDPPSQAAWMDGDIEGYASYYVAPWVKTHNAYGLGVYSNFDKGVPIIETSAISVPNTGGVQIVDAMDYFLGSQAGAAILYVVDDAGGAVNTSNSSWYLPFY